MPPKIPPVTWLACEEPERPPDENMGWHFNCPACGIKRDAFKRQGGSVVEHPTCVVIDVGGVAGWKLS